MRCETCGDYIYKGKKFNARKERVEGDDYLGIHIFRFYIRCPRCASEITFKTDPKNSDYVAEHGAQRNFEPWREDEEASEEKKVEREQEEENNPMKALENRTMESKREMDILDALDEIRTKNAQIERVDAEVLLDKIFKTKQAQKEKIARQQEDEDDAIAKAIFKSSDGENIRRIWEEEQGDEDGLILPKTSAVGSNPTDLFSTDLPELQSSSSQVKFTVALSSNKRPASNQLSGIVVKKAAKGPVAEPKPSPILATTKTEPLIASSTSSKPLQLSGLADYGSDSE
jgi:rubredoxin